MFWCWQKIYCWYYCNCRITGCQPWDVYLKKTMDKKETLASFAKECKALIQRESYGGCQMHEKGNPLKMYTKSKWTKNMFFCLRIVIYMVGRGTWKHFSYLNLYFSLIQYFIFILKCRSLFYVVFFPTPIDVFYDILYLDVCDHLNFKC